MCRWSSCNSDVLTVSRFFQCLQERMMRDIFRGGKEVMPKDK